MKIAFLVGRFPTLSETFILNQITGLIDRGHEVDVYGWPSEDEKCHDDIEKYDLLKRTYTAPSLPDSYLKRAIKGGGLLTQLLFKRAGAMGTLNLLRYRRLAASLRLLYASVPHAREGSREYDVVHCHFGQNGILALALQELGFLNAKRILTTFHGHDVYVDVPRYSSSTRRMLFKKGDGFTVNSEYTARNVVELGGKEEDIEILPVGLDVESFSYQIRRREGGEPVRVLTVGRLVEKKGIEFAIRALGKLKDELTFEYRVVGGGPLRETLEQLTHQLGVADQVTFLGPLSRDEVREQYQWAHLFTLPSVTAEDGDREGQGLVLQEAQACGLPVVATRHNGFPDGVKEGESAVLVPERDVDALAEALSMVASEEDRWEEMGRYGRSLVEERYDTEVLSERLVDIYRDLLDRGATSTGELR